MSPTPLIPRLVLRNEVKPSTNVTPAKLNPSITSKARSRPSIAAGDGSRPSTASEARSRLTESKIDIERIEKKQQKKDRAAAKQA